MPLHPQRQGLHALQNLERRGRTHTGPKIPRTFFAGPGDKRSRPEFLNEVHVVKTFVRLGQRGKFAGACPVKGAAIDHQAADDDAMTAQELCCRVKNQVRAEGEGLAEIGCCKSGVDHQRQSVGVRHLADRRDIQYLKTRIAQGLAEKQPCLRRDRCSESVRIARVNKRRRDAEAGQRVLEKIMGAAVK